MEILKHPSRTRLGISTQNKRELPRTWAFDVHEVRIGGLYETLQLVLLRLSLGRGVEEIDGERLFDEM